MPLAAIVVAELRDALKASANGLQVDLRALEVERTEGMSEHQAIEVALDSRFNLLHVQSVDRADVLRQVHDSLAQEPAFSIGPASNVAGIDFRQLCYRFIRALADNLREANAVHEFWTHETKRLYDERAFVWEFAICATHEASYTVLFGYSCAPAEARPRT